MASIAKLTVDITFRVNGQPTRLWRARALCFVARLLGVRFDLSVGEGLRASIGEET